MFRTSTLSLLASAVLFQMSDAASGAANGEANASITPAAAPAPATALNIVTAASDNVPLAPISDETKIEAIAKAMRSREIFATPADALNKLAAAAKNCDNFYGLPVAIRGYNAETQTVDPAVYGDNPATLAYLTTRVDNGKGGKIMAVKGIVMYATPTVEAFAANESGAAWLAKIANKEMSLISSRKLRNASSIAEFVSGLDSAPSSVDEYVTEYSRASDDQSETFDAMWSGMRANLKDKQPALFKLLPSKIIVEKAMRSAAYAKSLPDVTAPLEEAGIFAKLLTVMIGAAKLNMNKDGTPNPLPTDGLENWLNTRDTTVISDRERSAPDFSVLGSLNF